MTARISILVFLVIPGLARAEDPPAKLAPFFKPPAELAAAAQFLQQRQRALHAARAGRRFGVRQRRRAGGFVFVELAHRRGSALAGASLRA